ncbi:MAG TPA: beta-(1-3)-glucosyl transferase, partial [Desulfurivibrionaceae bacterium]|nr:beta-(1-3)-glucosyl transferase [Desulfurivibrionaceae bacterium]
PLKFDPPLVILSIMPLALFVFKVGKMIYLYRTRIGASITQTLASAIAGLSLAHTIAQAICVGFVTSDKPFFRTPKLAQRHALIEALQSAREEICILIALWLAAVSVADRQGSDTADLMIWILVLLVQSIPYAAALFMAVASGFAASRSKMIREMTATPSIPPEAAPGAGH